MNKTETLKSRLLDLQVTLIQFVEGSSIIWHAPALDVSGYGNSMQEAERSFEISLREFLDHIEKAQLVEVLRDLGWRIDSGPVSEKSIPTIQEIAQHDEHLAEVISKKDFQILERTVSIPL